MKKVESGNRRREIVPEIQLRGRAKMIMPEGVHSTLQSVNSDSTCSQ